MKSLSLALIPLLALMTSCNSLKKWTGNEDESSPLMIEEVSYLPRQILLVSFPIGAGSIPKEKQGVTQLLSSLVEEGPQSITTTEFKRKLFLLNADFSLHAGSETTSLVLRAPEKTVDEALALALETLKQPKIKSDFDKIKNRVLTNRKLMNESMREVIYYFGRRDLYDYHPRTLDGTGSPKSIAQITPQDVKNFSESLSQSKPFAVVTAGPIKKQKMKELVENEFVPESEFSSVSIAKIPVEKYLNEGKTKVTIINKTGVTDNQVLFMKPHQLDEDTETFVTGEVAHHLLGGGGLAGRLFKELREKRGLTYGAFSGINGPMKRWAVYSFASTDKLEALIKEMSPVVDAFQKENVSAENLKDAQQSLISQRKQQLELPQDRLLEKMRYRIYNLDPEFMNSLPDHIEAVTAKNVQTFAGQHIQMKGGSLYLMGDATNLKPIMGKLGWTPEEIEVVNIEDIY